MFIKLGLWAVFNYSFIRISILC